jgi:hypothetical protein
MGDNGAKTSAAIRSRNPGLPLTSTPPVGTEAKYPYVINDVTYKLRVGVDAAKLMTALKHDPAVLLVEVGRRPRLVPAWQPLGENTTAPLWVQPGPGWPFTTLEASDIPEKQNLVTIAIVDSGIAQDDDRFQFWRRPKPSRMDRGTGATVFCDSVSVGCNLLTRTGFPADDITAPRVQSHGTHVAGLASGRLAPDTLRRQIDDRVRLMILKVAGEDGSIDTGLVYDAILYAALNAAPIVNLSLSGGPSSAIHDAMSNAKSQLFVVAAGNTETDLGSDLTRALSTGYPARYAGELPNVISVAAHDPQSRRACFSNFGAGVDIAAPGVDVDSTVVYGTAKLSGTSQAAPLVSLAAALLLAAGYSQTPDAIKNRLLVSADVVPELHGIVSSEGKLNIRKALAFSKDLMELRDHRLLRGEIDPSEDLDIEGEPRPVSWDRVLKVVVNYSDVPGKRSRVTFLRDGKLVNAWVDLKFSQVRFRPDNGKLATFPLTDILDIIPASDRGV